MAGGSELTTPSPRDPIHLHRASTWDSRHTAVKGVAAAAAVTAVAEAGDATETRTAATEEAEGGTTEADITLGGHPHRITEEAAVAEGGTTGPDQDHTHHVVIEQEKKRVTMVARIQDTTTERSRWTQHIQHQVLFSLQGTHSVQSHFGLLYKDY